MEPGQAMAANRVKPTQITFRVEQHFKEAAEEAARRDSRSLTSLMEKLLRDYMRSVGIDPDKPLPPNPPG